MKTVEQSGMEVRATAGTEACTSHPPAHPQAARASAASQHPAAPVKHFPSFLQEAKTAARSCSPATADHRLRNCHSPAPAALHLRPDFLFPAQFSCHLQGLIPLPALTRQLKCQHMP